MISHKKNRNILCTLRNRELNTFFTPEKLSVNIMRQLIASKNSVYKCSWKKESSQPITYDTGLLYFNNYTTCYTIYGPKCQPFIAHKIKSNSAKKKIGDIIVYSTPVLRKIDQCTCGSRPCSCLSRFIVYLTEDNWLCQYNLNSGLILKEVYVKRMDHDFRFKYCNWDVYGELIVLTSALNPEKKIDLPKPDVVVNLAVFTIFPLEFIALLEIKRSVFGKDCNHANVSDQLLIIGIGCDKVHIYSFRDVLIGATWKQYNIGQEYSKDKRVGEYPLGLPFNCDIHSTPALLFDVQCFGQTVHFGGFPYHCIYADRKNKLLFNIRKLKDGAISKNRHMESNVWNDEADIAFFHPDSSNRVILRKLLEVHCYKINYNSGKFELKETYRMSFPNGSDNKRVSGISSYGRKIKMIRDISVFVEKSILAIDYDDQLDLFGILGVHTNDPLFNGFVKMFDSLTGEEIKCIKLDQTLCETNYYQLYIELDAIIVIEKNERNVFRAFVFRIHEDNVTADSKSQT